ncbi:MAG: 3'(2'),5'-bisphosphate nucleotidase CysQ [Polyangiaceae bacterium]|nr:3'(2'),5'-bisphosphate nucleotidase CysQ [Polyangiaceae bacterium]
MTLAASATKAEQAAMLRLAREAATLVLQVRDAGFEVEMKAADDPVTRADKEANQLICGSLAAEFPSHGVLGEESVPAVPAELAALLGKDRVFFVDPVDGTREFAEKRHDFCVMIGLAVDGRAVAGAIAVPMEKKLFWGDIATGAFLEDEAGNRRELHVAPVDDPRKARAVVSRSHPSAQTAKVLEHLGITSITPCGSVGVKAARVIEGAADLYVHVSKGAKLWDACAPEAILRGAGGSLTDLAGHPIDYRGILSIENGLVASSPSLLPKIVDAIRAIRS